MSKKDNTDNDESGIEKPDLSIQEQPKKKIQSMFQELEIMAMQKNTRNAIDLSKLDKTQIDKVLNTMAENENNAFVFHTKRLDAIKEIELRKIDASVISQNTTKIVLIGSVLVIIPILTLAILFFKESYFIPWLTFVTGILGGFGISKATNGLFKLHDTNNPIKDSDEL
jgi:hypothetical protein